MDNSAIITATVTVMIAFKFLQRHEVISLEALAAGRISGEVRYEDDQKLSQILSTDAHSRVHWAIVLPIHCDILCLRSHCFIS